MWLDSFTSLMLAEEVSLPIHQRTSFMLSEIAAALVLSIGAASYYCNRIRMSEYGWKLGVMIFSVLASIILISGLPLRFGVDLSGGVTYVGRLEKSDENDAVSAQMMVTMIRQRIDPAGVKDIIVRALGEDHIEIIIPHVQDDSEAERIWQRVVQAGYLKFRIVAVQTDSVASLAKNAARNRNRRITEPVIDEEGNQTEKVIASWVEIGRALDENQSRTGDFTFIPSPSHIVRDRRTGELLNLDQGFSDEASFTAWAEDNDHEQIEILVLVPRSGAMLSVSISPMSGIGMDRFGRNSVDFRLKGDGPRNMGALTRQYRGRGLGIVLDDKLLSAPEIQSEINREGQITGRFTRQEVEDLISILKGGALPTPINEHPISRDQVNSSIGRDLQQRGIFAIGISFAVVIVFMLFYYRFAGLIACLALLTNLALILGIVVLIKQPITLTGLAGLVLTVGMSVDANVLIFERIREELGKGSNLRMAIRNGFGRATVTIVDANLTTLITALVLYTIGTEQIRGFCVALILGIVMSMFTAIFCSRVTFDIAERQRWIKSLKMVSWVSATSFDFVGKRRIALSITGAIILVGMVCAVGLGDSIFGHDLRGGTTARIVFTSETDADSVRESLEAAGVKSPSGEPIEWEVTRITSSEEVVDDYVFKINSSLQPYDDSQEEGLSDAEAEQVRESYQSLQQVLDKVFAGQLAKYEVTIGGSGAEADSSYLPRRSGLREHQELIASQPSDASSTEKLAFTAPPEAGTHFVSYGPQDQSGGDSQGSGDQGAGDQGAGDQGAGDQSAGDQGAGDQGADDQGADDQGADDQGADDQGADDQSAGEQTNSAPPISEQADDDTSGEATSGEANAAGSGTQDALTPQENEAGTTQQEPEAILPSGGGELTLPNLQDSGSSLDEATPYEAVLSFNYPAAGESIRETIYELAQEAGFGILPEDILLTPENEAVDAPTAESWEVTITTNQPERVADVLEATKEKFGSLTYFSSISEVGGQIAQQSQVQALVAVLLSLVGIVAYLWFRFQRVVFGLAAVVALVHDVLFVIGAIAATGYLFSFIGLGAVKISLPVVAAFLTIIGYSLNDTIVVFDRIREVRGKNPDLTSDMINRSIGQTLGRTVLTSFTTFIVVFILLVGGGDAIKGFAFALVVGVLVGTYSSIFVASPVLLWLIQSGNAREQQRKLQARASGT